MFGIEKGVATGVDRRIGKIEQADAGWNKSRASRILGISRERLRNKMNRHGLPGKPSVA